jgi:hypothetical protein
MPEVASEILELQIAVISVRQTCDTEIHVIPLRVD